MGIGFSIVVPLIVLQSAMPVRNTSFEFSDLERRLTPQLKEMAATTGAWSVTRTIGGSVGELNVDCGENSSR